MVGAGSSSDAVLVGGEAGGITWCERKFGPEEGKKEKQVRRKQEGGTSRGLARGTVQHLLL